MLRLVISLGCRLGLVEVVEYVPAEELAANDAVPLARNWLRGLRRRMGERRFERVVCGVLLLAPLAVLGRAMLGTPEVGNVLLSVTLVVLLALAPAFSLVWQPRKDRLLRDDVRTAAAALTWATRRAVGSARADVAALTAPRPDDLREEGEEPTPADALPAPPLEDHPLAVLAPHAPPLSSLGA